MQRKIIRVELPEKNPYRHFTLNVNVHKTLELTSTTLKKLELIVA